MALTESALAEVVERFGGPPSAVAPLGRILVLQAQDPTASTTIRDPKEALDRHVADSLVALSLPIVRAARRIADLGSGAGWPGLALAAALPASRVTLVESASRRVRYLERAVAAARLANAQVVHARAEAWPQGVGAHDLVTARALAALPVVLEYAAPLLEDGGHVVAWKGMVDEPEAADAAAAALALGLEVIDVLQVRPFRKARERWLHVFRKHAPTPARFPRRPGMAAKRPLRATN